MSICNLNSNAGMKTFPPLIVSVQLTLRKLARAFCFRTGKGQDSASGPVAPEKRIQPLVRRPIS
jgi:hypothetical protein